MIVVALCMVAFFIGGAMIASDLIGLLLNGELGGVKAALVLPMLAAVALVLAAIVGVFQWLQGSGTRATRVRHTLAVVVSFVFLWSLNTWNLLGWRF
jgi:hypothetical protein